MEAHPDDSVFKDNNFILWYLTESIMPRFFNGDQRATSGRQGCPIQSIGKMKLR